MIAQFTYGSGIPFHRLARLEELLGIPQRAATQWEKRNRKTFSARDEDS